jgi:carbonic anhydrase
VQKLVRGVHKFQANYFAKHKELFRQLATAGQQPETLFITCSDSRVVPHLITSAAPGELFILRNVGNVVPPYDPANAGATTAALEYAVCVLNVAHIIVCGHTQCGAINALLDPDKLRELPYVSRWLRHSARLRDLIATRYTHLEGDDRLTAAAEENVLVQLEHLRGYPFIARALEEQRLQMNGWVFKIATGQVFDFDPEREEFLRLGEVRSIPPPPRGH